MRVEPAPHVFRNEDRRTRDEDRRGTGEERRTDQGRAAPDARRIKSRPWFEPIFGAHLLGQIENARTSREAAQRAYLQPESRTPLRPHHETHA
jgi:hypothetical protein